MRLQKQPNCWSCLPTAVAILLDVDLKDVLDKLGHDGSEILFPDLPDPIGRRAFVIQEIQYIMPHYGIALVEYSPGIIYSPTVNHTKEIIFDKFGDVFSERNGLLFGVPHGKKLGHVVSWLAIEGLIYDPNGTKYPFTPDFTIHNFFGAYRC